eukprot:2873901-Lingulodinium_polyedra.AAC.1
MFRTTSLFRRTAPRSLRPVGASACIPELQQHARASRPPEHGGRTRKHPHGARRQLIGSPMKLR